MFSVDGTTSPKIRMYLTLVKSFRRRYERSVVVGTGDGPKYNGSEVCFWLEKVFYAMKQIFLHIVCRCGRPLVISSQGAEELCEILRFVMPIALSEELSWVREGGRYDLSYLNL